jgi:hypothetical protein
MMAIQGTGQFGQTGRRFTRLDKRRMNEKYGQHHCGQLVADYD